MAGVMLDQGEVIALRALLNNAAQSYDPILRLFTNDHAPAHGDTEAAFTEASGNGYAAITLTGANWSFTPGSPSSATYAQQEFSFTGALGNVYGYYITVNGVCLNAEYFTDGPYNIQNNGDKVRVTPTIRAGSATND